MTYAPFAKLVRDKIPTIMDADGAPYVARHLEGNELRAALFAKLVEEKEEAEAARGEELPELADIFEVLRATAAHHGYTMADVETAADDKRDERGGFDLGLWVESR